MTRARIEIARLEIHRIGPNDGDAIAAFSCGDADLDAFLRDDAARLDAQHVARTSLARYDGALVGYITLLCDAIVLETRERKSLSLYHGDHPVIPALKIARLGVSETFRATHRGAGEALMRYAASMAAALEELAGCRLLTLDAYAESAAFYERLGFVRNRAKEYREREHPSMRLDLYAPTLPAWVTS